METLITNGLIIFSKTTFNPFMTETVTISAKFYISYRNQSLDLQYSAMAGFYLKCKTNLKSLKRKRQTWRHFKAPSKYFGSESFFRYSSSENEENNPLCTNDPLYFSLFLCTTQLFQHNGKH